MTQNTKKCPFCNADLPDKANFCVYCMNPLNQKKIYTVKKASNKSMIAALISIATTLVFVLIFLLNQNLFISNSKYDTNDDLATPSQLIISETEPLPEPEPEPEPQPEPEPEPETNSENNNIEYAFDPRYNGVTITNIKEFSEDGICTVPGEIGGQRVIGLSANCFSDNEVCSRLRGVVLPESVLYVSDYAFSDCHNLKHVYCYNSLTTISERAFYGGTENVLLHFPQDAAEIAEHTTCSWYCRHDLEYYITNGFSNGFY